MDIFSEASYFKFLCSLIHPGDQVALVIDPIQRVTISAISRDKFQTIEGFPLLAMEVIPLNAAGQPIEPIDLATLFKQWASR